MILVTGASGFVGSKIMQICKDVIACPSLRGLSEDAIKRIVEESQVDAIVHTAAIANMQVCEADPDKSYLANVQIPVALAKASKNIKLLCFSTDQVYNGTVEDGPYTEDMVNPANVYAKHKLEMEQRVLDIAPDSVMLRAEWMYDYCFIDKPNYFMKVMKAQDSVTASSKQYRGVTYVKEVAENIPKAMLLPGGAYNYGSETTKCMYDITKDFLALIGKDIRIEDVPPPSTNLLLNCQKARNGGVIFSDVDEGLRKCAKDHGIVK